jgi:acetyl esterase/lipase
MLYVTVFILILVLIYTTFPILSRFIQAQNDSTSAQNITYQGIPTTISKEAQEELRKITFDPSDLKVPDPYDLDGWKKQYNYSESIFRQLSQPIVDSYQHNITEAKLGGLQVFDVKPKNWSDHRKMLVYIHGGAYTFGCANSTLGSPVLAANATDLRGYIY